MCARGPLCLCHTFVTPRCSRRALQTRSQMGTRFPFSRSSSCRSGFPGLGKAAERVQPVLLEQPVPPAAWHGAPSPPSPSGHARPSVRWAHPPAGLCFVVLGHSEKRRPVRPKITPSSQGQARRILLNAGKAEVGREETQSLDLMGRACSSDQIIINDWVWGGPATSMPSPCTLRVPVGRVPSQRRRAGEWKLNSSWFCWIEDAITELCVPAESWVGTNHREKGPE